MARKEKAAPGMGPDGAAQNTYHGSNTGNDTAQPARTVLLWRKVWADRIIADAQQQDACAIGIRELLYSHYWKSGALPDSDAALTRLCCCTRAEWTARRKFVLEGFTKSPAGWSNPAMDKERVKAAARPKQLESARAAKAIKDAARKVERDAAILAGKVGNGASHSGVSHA